MELDTKKKCYIEKKWDILRSILFNFLNYTGVSYFQAKACDKPIPYIESISSKNNKIILLQRIQGVHLMIILTKMW